MPFLSGTTLRLANLSLDRVLQQLRHVDVITIHRNSQFRDRAAEMKAASYVWIAATLEQYAAGVVVYLIEGINSCMCQKGHLKTSIISFSEEAVFDSLRDIRSAEKWSRRMAVADAVNSADVCQLNATAKILDGRTVRARHFELIWRVFSILGSPMPSRLHAVALEDIASGRNTVAHGHEDPISFGRRIAVSDIERRVIQVQDVVDHVALVVEQYIAAGEFRR